MVSKSFMSHRWCLLSAYKRSWNCYSYTNLKNKMLFFHRKCLFSKKKKQITKICLFLVNKKHTICVWVSLRNREREREMKDQSSVCCFCSCQRAIFMKCFIEFFFIFLLLQTTYTDKGPKVSKCSVTLIQFTC